MFRRSFHHFWPVVLILLAICIPASCSENNTVSTASNIQPAIPAQQPATASVAESVDNNTQPAEGPAPSPPQILFLRINPHSVNINPFTKIPDLSTATRDIWVMDPDGSHTVNLTNGSVDAESADWSPDKSQIVFDSVNSYLQGAPISSISTMQADGSNIKTISPTGSSRHLPAWSPDGLKIAYSRFFTAQCGDGSCSYFTLFTFSPDGSGDSQVSFSPDHGYDLLPRWFPDSERIAFLRNETGFFHIYSGDIVKGNVTEYNIDQNPLYMPWFSLSPDAASIVYSHDLSWDYYHTGREIFIFDVKSGREMQLTYNAYADDNPCFSPDGKQIVFGSFGNTDETSGLFIMNADGTNPRKIPSSQYGDIPMQWR